MNKKIIKLANQYCKKCDELQAVKEETEDMDSVGQTETGCQQIMYRSRALSLAENLYLKGKGKISIRGKKFIDCCMEGRCSDAQNYLSGN